LSARPTLATPRRTRLSRFAGVAGLALVPLVAPLVVLQAAPAQAATSDACANGGFRLVNLATGTTVASGDVRRVLASSTLGGRTAKFGVRGRYVSFDIRLSDWAVFDYAFTGAANPLDITGGVRTPVFASKIPDHRGATLTSGVDVRLRDQDLVIERSGAAVAMRIQAKDCAQGGIFQMEPEREDGTRTRIVHRLASAPTAAMTPFYFDNPRFRERVGQYLGSECTSVETGPASQFCVQVRTRTNIANRFSPAFVARDSAQLAERVKQPDCNTATPVTPSVEHCGGVSVWDVASGGRMGFVSGEDATEVANSPTECDTDCQAQNQVQGQLANLGHPFPVPAGSRLAPRVSSLPLPPLTAS
jgi:hypothetical protein